MTERIGNELTRLVTPIVPLNLNEAETASYPYAVYSYTPVTYRTKDGVYKLGADVTLTVFAADYDTADGIASRIADALSSPGEDFTVYLRASSSDCVEGVWSIELDININQYR